MLDQEPERRSSCLSVGASGKKAVNVHIVRSEGRQVKLGLGPSFSGALLRSPKPRHGCGPDRLRGKRHPLTAMVALACVAFRHSRLRMTKPCPDQLGCLTKTRKSATICSGMLSASSFTSSDMVADSMPLIISIPLRLTMRRLTKGARSEDLGGFKGPTWRDHLKGGRPNDRHPPDD